MAKKTLIGTEDGNQDDMGIDIASGEVSGIETINPLFFKDKAEEEIFMNEKVVVHIEPGDKENEPLFVQTGHNGDTQYILRGKDQAVKRRFIYSLMIAKVVNLVSSFGKGPDGKEFNRLAGPSRNTHRFYLVDDSRKGREWFRQEIARI